MSLSYLDESDTDEEGGKVSKCFSEIEISTAQMRSSDLKGAEMRSFDLHILPMLSRVKNFYNFTWYLPTALRYAWQVVSIWTTPFIRNDACSGGKCCVFIGKLSWGLASLYWCVGCIKSCRSTERSYHIIEQKRYIHQLKEVRKISDKSCKWWLSLIVLLLRVRFQSLFRWILKFHDAGMSLHWMMRIKQLALIQRIGRFVFRLVLDGAFIHPDFAANLIIKVNRDDLR